MLRCLLAALFIHTTLHAQRPEHPTTQHPPAMAMMMIEPLGVPMERMVSGTTWIPHAAPLPARRGMAGSWLLMLHRSGFVQYDRPFAGRGAAQSVSLPWSMFLARSNVG